MSIPTFNFNRWLRRADVVIASSSAPNREPINLKRPHPADVWASNFGALNAIEIGITTGPVPEWQEIVMGYHNMDTVTDTWRITSANVQSDLILAPITDSGTIPIISGANAAAIARISGSLVKPAIYREATPQTTRWIRLELTTSDAPRIGVLAIDRPIEATKPIRGEVQVGNPVRFDAEFWDTARMLEVQEVLTVLPEGPVMCVLNPADDEYTHHRVAWGLRRVPNEPREIRQQLWSQRWVIDPYLPIT